jgi:hypothetical protein
MDFVDSRSAVPGSSLVVSLSCRVGSTGSRPWPIDQIPQGLRCPESQRPEEAGHCCSADANQCDVNELHGVYLPYAAALFGQYTSNVTDQARNIMRAFLHGLTGAGLFRRLDYPGAPTEFVDSRSLEEIRASGEFDHYCQMYREGKLGKKIDSTQN